MRKLLEQQVEPAYAVKIRELVPTRMEILGVRVPAIRALVRPFLAAHPEIDAGVACDFFDLCCKRPCREELLFAQGILERFRRKLDPAMWSRVDAWIDAIDNWEVCDQLSKNIAAELVTRTPALARDLREWARSDNPWRRRFALAASTALNQGGRSDVRLALDICEPLMRETEPIVQKAVGWALREAARKDAKAVDAFLDAQRDRALPRILREARPLKR
ncbi:MAG: DNA alkylation repair protein [Phycisphaerae bacterium]